MEPTPADPALIDAVIGVQQIVLDSVTVLVVLMCVVVAVQLFNAVGNLR